jgi:hypothetical protein
MLRAVVSAFLLAIMGMHRHPAKLFLTSLGKVINDANIKAE